MALPPSTTNQAFVREVDDELRRDQLASVWERYGRWIVVAVVAALALFAGYLYWQHRRAVAAGAEGETLQTAYDALAENRFPAAAKPLAQLAGSGRDGYRAMAIFTQADLLLQKDDLKGAAAKFAAVADDASLPSAIRDLALIRRTSAEYDTLAPQGVVDRLRPLAVSGNPYLGSAGEMLAVAYLRTGRRDLANRTFGLVAGSADVPPSLRQRAVQMAGLTGTGATAQSKDVTTR